MDKTVDQLGFAGMPERLFSCTPSRLTTWLDCPRRYRMTYVDRPAPVKGPAWAHNTLGAAVHVALARLWELPVLRRTPVAARALLESAWKTDGFENDEQSDVCKGRAGDMLEAYVGQLDTAEQPPGVERTVAFKTERLAVSGRVDRVDDRDGELVVVDYKTGRAELTEDDARGSLALALYALGVRRTFRRPCTTVELHHLPTGRVLAWEHNEDTLARHVRRAEAVASEIQAARTSSEYPARASTLCGWCDYIRHCPEGLAASGGPHKPWAGLAPT